MKYRVIGWTYYESNEFLDSGNTIGFAERNAIIDEIRRHGYLFSGFHHQESWDGVVPILNDGRKRCFSQRGWGGVMAEAYGHEGKYDYAAFTFSGSLSEEGLRFAPECYSLDDVTPEVIENEDFTVTVNEGLFALAKVRNPFYLEDTEALRYLDHDDTVTLRCGDETLFFVVKDVDRSPTAAGPKAIKGLIHGKYKITLTHKPESERVLPKPPVFLTGSNAMPKFLAALDNYDYDVLEAVIQDFEIDYLVDQIEDEARAKETLTQFVRDYSLTNYESAKMSALLSYLDCYTLFYELALSGFEKHRALYTAFIHHYSKKRRNMDEHILFFAAHAKPDDVTLPHGAAIFRRAIALLPNNKALRKAYYRGIKDTRHEGLWVMAGGGLFRHFRKSDRCFLEPHLYATYDDSTIRRLVEYLTYPQAAITCKSYPFFLPKLYEEKDAIVTEGMQAYRRYIDEHFDMEALMEPMILAGIDKACFEMDRYMNGEQSAAQYVYAMDLMTEFRYDFRKQAEEQYAPKYEAFPATLDEVYKKYRH